MSRNKGTVRRKRDYDFSEQSGHYTVSASGCWEWNKHRDSHGYGRIGPGKLAHRFFYEKLVGSIPDGESVCHSCDNPPCVNPNHLWLGSISDNIQDCVSKGRHRNASKTSCPKGHAYTPENTYSPTNRNARYCRTCNRIAVANYRNRLERERGQ